ncbi:MAG: hypothetical protein HC805_05860 [Alkalinema sp. RL_2_19]|nr:hypothetical protein [Alkalinema sp. RL_2_19]
MATEAKVARFKKQLAKTGGQQTQPGQGEDASARTHSHSDALSAVRTEAMACEWDEALFAAGAKAVHPSLRNHPALLSADGPSTVQIVGGTHNPLAPPFDFLHHTWASVPIMPEPPQPTIGKSGKCRRIKGITRGYSLANAEETNNTPTVASA